MSFSISTEVHSAAEIRSAVEHTQPGAATSDGNERLIAFGKRMAIEVLDSGEVGDADAEREDTYFRVQISGHAAGDEPLVGDLLTVTVNQVPPPA